MGMNELVWTLRLIKVKGSASFPTWDFLVPWEEQVPPAGCLVGAKVIVAPSMPLPGVWEFVAAWLDMLLTMVQPPAL